jgi:hypothetical protein
MLRLGFLLSVLVAVSAQAQHNRLGIFDDQAMTQAFGVMDGPMKSVWIGMPAGSVFAGNVAGFEFSVSGLEAFDFVLPVYPISPTVVIGNVAAPPDTTTGMGGINVGWALCLPPAQPFMELQLFDPMPPQDHELRILRRFPPSNPTFPHPRAFDCGQCFCVFVLRGESYILNPTVRAETRSWSAIKQLYRTRGAPSGW